MNNWIARWPVSSMTTDKVYTVAMRVDGTWGCDCPAWKFHKAPKADCKHILKVKQLEPVDVRRNRAITFEDEPTLKETITRGQAWRLAAKPAPLRSPTVQPAQPYFVTQTRRAITLED